MLVISSRPWCICSRITPPAAPLRPYRSMSGARWWNRCCYSTPALCNGHPTWHHWSSLHGLWGWSISRSNAYSHLQSTCPKDLGSLIFSLSRLAAEQFEVVLQDRLKAWTFQQIQVQSVISIALYDALRISMCSSSLRERNSKLGSCTIPTGQQSPVLQGHQMSPASRMGSEIIGKFKSGRFLLWTGLVLKLHGFVFANYSDRNVEK